jgi:hypothetical protein
MGSFFDYRTYGEVPEKELRELFRRDQESACYENGHGPYSGHIGIADGLVITRMAFDTQEAAEKYVDEHTEKWGPALAVHVKGRGWLVGARCAS